MCPGRKLDAVVERTFSTRPTAKIDGPTSNVELALKVLDFPGSRRKSSPPLPARLGERVRLHLAAQLGEQFDVTVVDPLDYPSRRIQTGVRARTADPAGSACRTRGIDQAGGGARDGQSRVQPFDEPGVVGPAQPLPRLGVRIQAQPDRDLFERPVGRHPGGGQHADLSCRNLDACRFRRCSIARVPTGCSRQMAGCAPTRTRTNGPGTSAAESGSCTGGRMRPTGSARSWIPPSCLPLSRGRRPSGIRPLHDRPTGRLTLLFPEGYP